MRNACQFDALDSGNGYALLLKLKLDATAQLSRDFILASRRGAHLQAHSGRRAVKLLDPQNPRTVHEGLGPGGVASQIGSGRLQRLKSFFDGTLRCE